MKRLVLMALGAFVLSLTATTGTLVATGRGAAHAVAADSTAADSASAHAAARLPTSDTTAPRAHSTESTPSHRSAPDPVQPAPPAAVPEPEPGAHAAQADTGADNRLEDQSYRQLARIFANMKTADAVKVLAYMSDDEVQGVIEQLGVRQAAGLLGALPKERAATLSRRLLQSGMQPEIAR